MVKGDTAGATGSYLLAVQTPVYRLSDTSFAIESAFSHHLKELREQFAGRVSKFVIIAPEMSADRYRPDTMATIDAEDGITLVPAHPDDVSVKAFWTQHAARMWREVNACIADARVVHSGLASDLWRPTMMIVNLAAWRRKKPLMFIVDIDFRNNTRRLRKMRVWGLKSYLTNRLFHDPVRWLQVFFTVRISRLALLKGPGLVRDFGAGKPHVKNFLDTAFSAEQVLTADELDARVARLENEDGPLQLVYFGRLVPYKGLHLAIDAIKIATAKGHDVRLTIIGEGPCLLDLRRQVRDARLSGSVTFLPAVPYGKPLFDLLSHYHASIACPLMEDTPRATIDSMARGLPVLAFDLDYFKGLAEIGGAVTTAQWPDAGKLAETFARMSADRPELIAQTRRAVDFARANTQQIWLERRRAWVEEYLFDEEPGPVLHKPEGAFA